MPNPQNPPEPPSQWEVISDYSKTVITLASALLSVTVTFSQELLGKVANSAPSTLLIWAWTFLLLAVTLGVATLAFVIAVLRKGEREQACIFCCNAGFWSLVVAVALFARIGWLRINAPQQWSTGQVVEETLSRMPQVAHRKGSQWNILSLNWNARAQNYLLLVMERQTAEKWNVIVDAEERRIIRAAKRK